MSACAPTQGPSSQGGKGRSEREEHPNLSLAQIYPPAAGGHNINTCHDPDCGNFGIEGHFRINNHSGSGASAGAAIGSNSRAVGLGRYKLDGTKRDQFRRVSTVFEYQRHPHKWLDGKILECQFDDGSGSCGTHFELHSNEHLVEEIERLRSANGIFEGPACRTCGVAYLDAPDEFILDGAELGGVGGSGQLIRMRKVSPDLRASA